MQAIRLTVALEAATLSYDRRDCGWQFWCLSEGGERVSRFSFVLNVPYLTQLKKASQRYYQHANRVS
jgi:hypothetical protein